METKDLGSLFVEPNTQYVNMSFFLHFGDNILYYGLSYVPLVQFAFILLVVIIILYFLIGMMIQGKEQAKQKKDSVMKKISESEYTLREYVILASIIEWEAMYDEERNLVSAVFHNRLRKSARLQADPTIQFIINDGPRRLLKKDLEIDSPYNTYIYRGLPPGPICNPVSIYQP